MIEINDKQVAFSTTLLIPDGIEAKVSQVISEWPLKFVFVFKPNEGDKTSYVFSPEGDTMRMTFLAWKNSLGTALLSPVKIGTTGDGRNVGVMLFHQKAGAMNRIDFQILLGGVYA
jgi:hypothetical protein